MKHDVIGAGGAPSPGGDRGAQPGTSEAIDARVFTHVDASLGIACWHDLQVVYLAGLLLAPQAAAIERTGRAHMQRCPGGIISLTIVKPDAPPPSAELCRRLARLRGEHGAALRHTAVVIEGSGVWSRTMRTLLRGLDLLSSSERRIHMHIGVEEACQAALPHVRSLDGKLVLRSELPLVIAGLRERVARQRAEAP